jgi:acyl-CoA synthetase (NDP forming)
LLSRFGISMPDQAVVADVDGAIEAARRMGSVVALKAIVPGVLHRTEIGAVAKGLPTPEAVGVEAERMIAEIPGFDGFLVQRWVGGQVELFIGMRRDPVLGAFLVVGLGGIWVELIGDFSIRPVPIDESQALEMFGETKSSELLDGFRGLPRIDREHVARVIVAVSDLVEQNGHIEHIDLNPLLVGPDGLFVVDAQLVVGADVPKSDGRPVRDLTPMLKPRDVTVIGASNDLAKPGGRLVSYLQAHNFPGTIYPVNLRGGDVLDLAAHTSVLDLPTVPDLACISVPASQVVASLEQCIVKGIPAAIVYSSGVENSNGSDAESLARLVDRGEILISGPNTAGIVNSRHSLFATISMAFDTKALPRGRVGFITQSGALGSSIISRLWDEGVGFSHWISSGNEADVTLSDYLRFLVDDPDTDVITAFVESIRDRDGFAEAADLARDRRKPIIVYKTGVSEPGRQAVQSHTSALAGDDNLYEAFFKACGVVRVNDLQTLLDASIALAWQPIPRGNRVAVVTASGGVSSVTADESAIQGLDLHPFSPATVARIDELIPSYGRSQNPVDVTIGVTQQPTMIPDVAEVLLDDPEFDAVLVVLTTNAGKGALEVAKGLSRLGNHPFKPLLVARVSSEKLAPAAIAHYRANEVPVFSMPERAVRTMGVMSRIPFATIASHDQL